MSTSRDVTALSVETRRLLAAFPATFHPAVRLVTVHGSRGPAGGWRPDSDLDLCLLVDTQELYGPQRDSLLREVLADTIASIDGPVELDIAAVHDISRCGLSCFERGGYNDFKCPHEKTGCLGVYKTGHGFDGHVPPITEVKKMFPFAVAWRRPAQE